MQLPTHISLIMDGNGRWAKERGQSRIFGHYQGVESVRAVMETAVDLGIKYLSFYAFSEENWNRPEDEVVGLMELMGKMMRAELNNFNEHNIRFVVIGNRKRLSDHLIKEIDYVMGATVANTGLTMILFLSYSGRWDIVQAAEKLAHDLNSKDLEIDNDSFSHYLATDGIPDPDLLIRTSGEKRISNYLLWQLAYTEFVFTDTLWPDFRKEQFLAAIEEYSQRDRRYGKVR